YKCSCCKEVSTEEEWEQRTREYYHMNITKIKDAVHTTGFVCPKCNYINAFREMTLVKDTSSRFKLRCEKIIRDGKKAVKILDWENCFKKDDLPSIYTNDSPSFYQTKIGRIRVNHDEGGGFFRKETVYDLEDFEEIIHTLEEAGHRLHNIRQNIKELKKEWNGEEVITI
ncbi:MAG: hypothetical protein ACOCRO_09535, partial [Halanaerobiales bacterium]